ncbi:MAG: protein lplB [Paenibacillus sp.]|jgi:putative aldouronate transport system permease protein|nr:protein lplB [Paenibacillus sp.]
MGNIIAFQDYDMFRGIFKSSWVGLDQFVRMFTYADFAKVFRNTILISLYSVLIGFPAPLILVLFLNEINRMWFKRSIQSMLYLPHFLSWVIVGGIFINLLNEKGFFNTMIGWFGISPINFITEQSYFRSILVLSGIWKEVGWGMIIYLAAIAGINPNLYEAAMVDGAGRFRQMWSITLPCLVPAIVVLFLLRIGHLLDLNLEQVLILLNPLVRDVGEVIDTYVYRIGLMGAQFSYTTAIGIFKSVIGFVLIVSLNHVSKKMTGESIY